MFRPISALGAVLLVAAFAGRRPQPSPTVRFYNDLDKRATLKANGAVLFENAEEHTGTGYLPVTDSIVIYTLTVPGSDSVVATTTYRYPPGSTSKYTVTATTGQPSPLLAVTRDNPTGPR